MFQQKVKYLSVMVVLLSALTVSASDVEPFFSDLFSSLPGAANFVPALTKTWDGGGATNNWSEAANWSGDTVPTAGDDIVFDANSTKNATIDVSITVDSIEIASGYAGTITQAANLTVSGCSGRPCFQQNGGTFNGSANTITLTSGGFDGLRMNGGTFNGGSGDISIPNGPSLGANLRLLGGSFKSTSGALSVAGSIIVQNATFLHNNGTVNLTQEQQNGITLNSQNSTITFNNVNFNMADGVHFEVPPRMIVLGNLTLNDGFIGISGQVIEARGAVAISPNFDGGNAILEFGAGGGTRTQTFAAGLNYPKIVLNDTNLTVNTSGTGTLLLPHQLIIQQGTFNQGNVDLLITPLDIGGGSCLVMSGGTFNGSDKLLTLNDNGFGTVLMTGGVLNGGSGNIISTGINSADDHRIIVNGGSFKSTSGTLFSGGSLKTQSPGVFLDNGGTVEFNGGGASSAIGSTNEQGVGQDIAFHNLKINKDDGNMLDTTLGGGIFVTGTLSLIDGRLGDGGGFRFIDASSNVNIASTFDGLTSRFTLRFSGAACQTITLDGTPNFPGNWEVSKSGCAVSVAGNYGLNTLLVSNGGLIINAGSQATLSGNLTINPAGSVTLGNASVVIAAGSATISGSVDLSGSNATVVINAAANVTPSGSVELSGINNVYSAGNGQIGGTVDLSGAGNILQFDSLTIEPGGELTADSFETITLGGDVVNNGLINLRGFGSECAPFAGTYVTIQSSVSGARRNWSGSGVFRMVHVNVFDMGGTAQIKAHNSVNSGNNDGNWTFDSVCQPRVLHTAFDFDGDGKSDVAMFRPSTGVWFLNRSTLGISGAQWGISTDKVTPADFDGDGITDVAVWREAAQANFFILQSADSTVRTEDFGITGDDPRIVGDWDGDGKADAAVYRKGTVQNPQSTFFFRGSKNNPNRIITFIKWGNSSDAALRGDFDADGKQDPAIFRPSDGNWWIAPSSNPSNPIILPWGIAGDKAVEGDYDGDGKSDLAVFRPSDRTWYILQSSNSQPRYELFGLSSDIPMPGDYDGDGKTDIAVWRSGQNWLKKSSDGAVTVSQFGLAGDIPVESALDDNL